MKLSTLSEVIWRFYQEGRPNVKDRTFGKRDVTQYLKLAVANILRKTYYDSKSRDDWKEADQSLISDLLTTIELEVGDADGNGVRKIDISGLEFYRFPNNSQLSNVVPLNNKCEGQQLKPSTLVKPGEHYFYTGTKFQYFLHHELNNKTILCYNWPSCVAKANVVSTIVTEDMIILLDVGYEAGTGVLNMMLGIKDKYDPVVLRKQLEKEAALQ